MKLRPITLAAAALAILSAVPSLAAAADITIMVGGVEKQIYLPAMLAQQLGYFKDEGITVDILSEPSGVDATDEMLAGVVQGVVGFYDHTVDLQGLGKYAESVVQFSQAPGEVELASSKYPDIKSFADFKGKNLGVTGLGSSTNFLTQYLAVKSGLQLSDITSVPVGAGDTLIVAMKQDQIQGAMTTEPTISRMLKTGDARILIDMRTLENTKAALGGTYPAASLYMQTDWVNAHKDLVQKMANAFVKTLKYINTHTGAEIAAQMPPDYYVGDEAGYIAALDAGKQMFTPDGVMPQGGPETVLAVLSQFKESVKGKTIDLSKTFTTEFVDIANKM
ncbi:ABC transporter substrate-binding protein [Devosia sp.]|uniref:ABC transporter substrate-binding protein n=1 Tax=Devosia sp. TaxID=1871048 RepID=UPI003266CE69